MVDNDKLKEYLEKWLNHLRFLEVIKKSNINKDVINIWENKIHFNFREMIDETLEGKEPWKDSRSKL